jgi:hypothetical protein
MAKQTLMMIVFKRLKSEGRWDEAEPIRNELAASAKQLRLKGTDSQNYTYTELAKQFPPLDGNQPETSDAEFLPKNEKANPKPKQRQEVGDHPGANSLAGDVAPLISGGDFSVLGLSEIPANWGVLPSNAQLSAEVSWVQANRLRVVRDVNDRVVVDLTKSLGPAPSWAALGWLETSIKTYSKFVDVAARATAGLDGEAADIRREVQSIEEVRKLLESML